jgi:hypothetical protein
MKIFVDSRYSEEKNGVNMEIKYTSVEKWTLCWKQFNLMQNYVSVFD